MDFARDPQAWEESVVLQTASTRRVVHERGKIVHLFKGEVLPRIDGVHRSGEELGVIL